MGSAESSSAVLEQPTDFDSGLYAAVAQEVGIVAVSLEDLRKFADSALPAQKPQLPFNSAV